VVAWALDAFEKSGTRSPTPVWAGPLIWVWNHTFHPRKPEKSFGEVVIPPVIKVLRKLSAVLPGAGSSLGFVRRLHDVPVEVLPLYGETFEVGRYKLSMLNEVKQGDILIGTFANLTSGVMWFDGGDHCEPINAKRTLKLELICNDENWFVSVNEPSTCAYEGVFATPIACFEAETKKFDGYKLKKLEEMAKFFHIDE
jgi:flagellar motor switch/type III secretory pathway protein FliN